MESLRQVIGRIWLSITLLSVVGKVFCKVLNNRFVHCLDKKGALHEGQAGFRVNRSCMDNVYILNKIVQGRLKEDKAFFLEVQKAYDTVWQDGLWLILWDMGVKGKMWRVINLFCLVVHSFFVACVCKYYYVCCLYFYYCCIMLHIIIVHRHIIFPFRKKNKLRAIKSAVFLGGQKSAVFRLEQGVAQGCSLSPILFSIFINDLLKVVEQAKLGVQLSSGKKIGGMLFADDFVGVSDSKESLQKLLDVVHGYCNKWRLK